MHSDFLWGGPLTRTKHGSVFPLGAEMLLSEALGLHMVETAPRQVGFIPVVAPVEDLGQTFSYFSPECSEGLGAA